jgi:hypothetical protein
VFGTRPLRVKYHASSFPHRPRAVVVKFPERLLFDITLAGLKKLQRGDLLWSEPEYAAPDGAWGIYLMGYYKYAGPNGP